MLSIERRDRGWRLRTQSGIAEADFCIVATGARNPLREVGTEWSAKDTMSALGYYVPASRDQIDIQFLPQLEGYIWVFPRCGHLSVGICGKGEPAQALRVRLEHYMDERGMAWRGSKFYSHMLPSLESPGWKNNRVAGEGWMAVGDAGGLVDPITGEGLYYAMRSGDLGEPGGARRRARDLWKKPRRTGPSWRGSLRWIWNSPRRWRGACSWALSCSTRCRRGWFNSCAAVRGSATLMQDLFAGTQPYLELRGRLLRNLSGTLREVLTNLLLNRVIPESSRAGL